MKWITSLFFLLLSALSVSAQTTPTGVWNTGTDNSQVEIKEVDGRYVGVLIASDNPQAKIGKLLLLPTFTISGGSATIADVETRLNSVTATRDFSANILSFNLGLSLAFRL